MRLLIAIKRGLGIERGRATVWVDASLVGLADRCAVPADLIVVPAPPERGHLVAALVAAGFRVVVERDSSDGWLEAEARGAWGEVVWHDDRPVVRPHALVASLSQSAREAGAALASPADFAESGRSLTSLEHERRREGQDDPRHRGRRSPGPGKA